MNRKTVIVSILAALLCAGSVFVFAGCNGRAPEKAPQYTVEYLASDGGTVTGDVCQTVQEGEAATPVTAIPDAGYLFVKWSDGVTAAARTDYNVTRNVKVTALFETRTLSLTYKTDGNGTIEGNSTQTVARGTDAATVTAIPGAGYKFVKWSDGVTTAARTDTAVTQNINVTALFEERMHTLTYKTDGNGTIEGNTVQTVERRADATPVTAVPDMGYKFVKWSDGVTAATRTDRAVTQNINVTAIFAEIPFFTVTYTAGEHGRILGNAKQTVTRGKDTGSVVAYADAGYKFVRWSDGNTDAQRTDCNVLQDISVTAIFAERWHAVTYKTEGHGRIEGEAEQSVRFYASAATVTAVPDEGYKFVRWSDYVYDAERTDTHITADFTVTAVFEPLPHTVTQVNVYADGKVGRHEYTVLHGETYTLQATTGITATYVFLYWGDGVEEVAREEVITQDCEFTAYYGYIVTYSVDGTGGTLRGPTTQKFTYNTVGEAVTAVPQSGYVFGGWSDLCAAPARTDAEITRHTEYVAYFEPVQKTFAYNYGALFKTPLTTQITVTRDTVADTVFAVPALADYTFGGWYADAAYKIKVADASGRPFLGYYTFLLPTDTLYAKWEKAGEEKLTYKILMVMTDELHASLYSSRADRMVDADYKMTAIERKILALIPPKMAEYLNTWFEGRVTFEVDTYFTLQPVGTPEQRAGEEMMDSGNDHNGDKEYDLSVTKMPELQEFLPIYHATLITFSYNDYAQLLKAGAGIAGHKHGKIFIESLWYNPLHILYDRLLVNGIDSTYWYAMIGTYLHEFTHTIEIRYFLFDDIYEYHKVLTRYGLEDTRLYLLHQYVLENGETVGIPLSYWENPAEWGREIFVPNRKGE